MNIKNHIPNSITGMNLFSGCISIVFSFSHNYEMAIVFIILAAVFDFFDGMAARLLNVKSEIGKELDSLADVVSFGVSPAMIIFCKMNDLIAVENITNWQIYIPYIAFIVPVFSALRLAKFNLDTRQTNSFIGVPTPANALLISTLVLLPAEWSFLFNIYSLSFICIAMSLLLVAEIHLIALKIKNLSWKDNRIRYIFVIGAVIIAAILMQNAIPFIIIWYVVISVIENMFLNRKV